MTSSEMEKDPVVHVIRSRMRQIILLTSYEDQYGSVWGMDTEVGKMDDLVNKALKIMNQGDDK